MSIGTLVFLLLIGGSLVAMFAMQRGGQSQRMGCGAGHSHGSVDQGQAEGSLEQADRPLLGTAAGQAPAANAGVGGRRHRGC